MSRKISNSDCLLEKDPVLWHFLVRLYMMTFMIQSERLAISTECIGIVKSCNQFFFHQEVLIGIVSKIYAFFFLLFLKESLNKRAKILLLPSKMMSMVCLIKHTCMISRVVLTDFLTLLNPKLCCWKFIEN